MTTLRRFWPLLFIAAITMIASGRALQAAPVQSFEEVREGIAKVKEQIEDRNLCGGWDLSVVSAPVVEQPDCTVKITCQPQDCEGQGGFTYPKDESGQIEVCVQDKGGKGENYIILHELQHVKQLCQQSADEDELYDLRTCCVLEREAYEVNCMAMEKDGHFKDSGITARDCVDIGSSLYSCGGYLSRERPTQNICGDGQDIPRETKDAFDAIMAGIETPTCQQSRDAPDPRIQIALNEIAAIGEIAVSATNLPVPTVTGSPGHRNKNPLYAPQSGMGLRSTFEYPTDGRSGDPANTEDNSGAWGFQTACDVLDPRYNPPYNPNGLCLDDKRTPGECKELYRHLFDLKGTLPRQTTCGIEEKLCVDYTSECTGTGCQKIGPPSFQYTPPTCHTDENGNTVIDNPEQIDARERPFYRHYDVTVTAPGSPQNFWLLKSECYDYYREDDTKFVVAEKPYEQCELSIRDESPNKNPEWLPRERQRGLTEPDPAVKDPDDPRRPERSLPVPWRADPNTNLSLLDFKLLPEGASEDLSGFLPYTAMERTVRQFPSKAATTARTDGFDDTGQRTFTRWWEIQQREIAKLLRQPTVRLTLPAQFLHGLEADDPLIRLSQRRPTAANGIVEVTVHAGPEELSAVIASLQKSLILPVSEVPIRILVPLVSEIELQSLIFQWRAEGVKHPENAAEIEALVAKLESYVVRVREVRRLRSVLPATLGRTLTAQKKIRAFAASWYEMNAARLLGWAQVAAERTNLQYAYQETASAMLETVDCQLNWCSNQRYSVPIYGLLDNWMLGRWTGSSKLPELTDLDYKLPSDFFFDFSSVGFPVSSLTIPILDPVEVAIKLPHAPAGSGVPDAASFPDLPPLPSFAAFESWAIPDIQFPEGIVQDEADPSGLRYTIPEKYLVPPSTQATEMLKEATKLVWQMWAMVKAQETYGMKNTYCRFVKSLEASPNPRSEKIIHVESELTERIARLFSRYATERTADFDGRQKRLEGDYGSDKPPCTDDLPCLPLSPEKRTSSTWQWLVSTLSQQSAISAIAESMKETVPSEEAKNPYFDAPLETLRRLFPALPIPIEIDLLPPSAP